MYKILRYLKIDGKIHDKGKVIDLSILNEKEIARLEKKGFVEKVEGRAIEEDYRSNENEKNDPNADDGGDGQAPGDNGGNQLTEEEVKADFLEKLNHGIVVKELKLLGADFKANASFEKLVELIMENEEYENHFLDYIDDNEL